MAWGELVLAFDTDDPTFARGVDIGRMWADLDHQGHAERIVKGNRTEMVMRMAESVGLPFVAKDLGDDWFEVRIGVTPAT